MRRIVSMLTIAAALLAGFRSTVSAQDTKEPKVFRIGMIGLDTSHAPAFTKLFNDPKRVSDGPVVMRVTAAFPGGSKDIESSHSRVEGYTKELQGLGVKMVDSVEKLVGEVDAVLLESVDGRPHLEQALPVLKAGKPLFIDKPLAGTLADAYAIDALAKKYKARWFSSSSLRFSPSIYRYRSDEALRKSVRGAEAWSPCSLEKTHPDLFWYGVHGVETLYTVMGTGCEQVTRTAAPNTDLVVGLWDGGRIGTFRGLRDGKADYGIVVFGDKTIESGGKYEGYAPLVEQIIKFFGGAVEPVSNDETLELFAFMQAAQVSKERGGAPVKIAEVVEAAKKQAQARISELDK